MRLVSFDAINLTNSSLCTQGSLSFVSASCRTDTTLPLTVDKDYLRFSTKQDYPPKAYVDEFLSFSKNKTMLADHGPWVFQISPFLGSATFTEIAPLIHSCGLRESLMPCWLWRSSSCHRLYARACFVNFVRRLLFACKCNAI